MALLGQAALAMWWNMAPGMQAEFHHWHSHEHFIERLGIPGFLRATRWRASGGGEAIFVMYELQGFEVLSSPAYVARLNAPSPWSARLMPHHREMVRSQCRVVRSRGAAVSGHCVTLRLSPGDPLPELPADLAMQAGITGVHVLRHETPGIAETTEQKIRGGADGAADRVVVVCGYGEDELRGLAAGWTAGIAGHFRLAHSATPGDVA